MAYCAVEGTPQTEAEVRTALDLTPPARRQQLHELLIRHYGHMGMSGEVEEDLYGLIADWPRWAMGGDDCLSSTEEYELKRDFLEWWARYGSGTNSSGPTDDRRWWERLEEWADQLFGSGGGGSLPPGSEPRIWGVAPSTLAILVLAVVVVYFVGRGT